MSCAGCVRSVESALREVPGVTSATVNFANESAAVLGSSSLEQLLSAVTLAGYTAEPYHRQSLDEQETAARATLLLALTRSGIALLGGGLLMLDMHLGLLPGLDQQWLWSGMGVLVLLIMAMTGGHFFRAAWASLRHGTATMDTLVSLGTGTAWLYSMLVILLPALVPEASRHQFFEAALFVVGFVNLGKALEANARTQASLAIQKLFDLAPTYVVRLDNGVEEVVPLEMISSEEILRVRPGEAVPVDGVIENGVSSIDQSMLSGESDAILVHPGDRVLAGTLNLDGSLTIRTEAVGDETELGRMIRLVAEAQNSKPPVAEVIDRISAVFVPAVVGLALLTFLAWLLLGPAPQLSFALVTAMSVLIIACPCALGLAIPMSIMVGLGRAASRGLLIRNSRVLEQAAKLEVLVVDKTGTLTHGEPHVTGTRGLDKDVMAMVLGLEIRSEHPLARAIRDYCEREIVEAVEVLEFSNHPGGGVSGRVGDNRLVLGTASLLRSMDVEVADEVRENLTVTYVARNGELVGYFLIEDQVRSEAADMIDDLSEAGVEVVMLSGDREVVVERVAKSLALDTYQGDCLPEDKLRYIEEEQAKGRVVGMAGDGINDSAALARADVAFAMGGGTDIAKESADVVLLKGSLKGIIAGIDLSKTITRNIRQNLIAAFGYNLLLIPVAAGVLYPFTGVLVSPALAGFAMALSSVSVVINASRLRFA